MLQRSDCAGYGRNRSKRIRESVRRASSTHCAASVSKPSAPPQQKQKTPSAVKRIMFSKIRARSRSRSDEGITRCPVKQQETSLPRFRPAVSVLTAAPRHSSWCRASRRLRGANKTNLPDSVYTADKHQYAPEESLRKGEAND